MSMLKSAACGVVVATLAACSSPSAPPGTSAAKPAQASTAMPASNPLTPLLNTRNRAQAVQQKLKAHDDAERKALQDAQQ